MRKNSGIGDAGIGGSGNGNRGSGVGDPRPSVPPGAADAAAPAAAPGSRLPSFGRTTPPLGHSHPAGAAAHLPVPDSRVAVRPATIADLASIVALRMALLREHAHNPIYGRLRPDADVRAQKLFAAQLQSPNEVIFLAEIAGECVGILRCIQSSGSPLLDPAQYAYVSSVYVVPAAREQGVLRSLLAAADSWCIDRGLDEMRLHNAADSPLANAAWAALGFEVAEHLRVRPLRPR